VEEAMFLQEYGERNGAMSTASVPPLFRGLHGRQIVLVHGGITGDASGGANAEDFDRNFADLARKFRVISVDRLTFGQRTTKLHGRSSAIDGGR
jgi:hypothetical protein